jgi:hypothetical protein
VAEKRERLKPSEIAAISERVFGVPVVKVTAPGGKARESMRIHFTGKTIVATQRKFPGRMRLEVEVLKRLSAAGAPVPKVLGGTEQLFFQEDMGSHRLTADLFSDDEDIRLRAADAAIDSLLVIHDTARSSGLEDLVPALGEKEEWVRGLVGSALLTADRFETQRPDIDIDALVGVLSVPSDRFLKWDARPGNASIGRDGRVYWFDWEHCGRRQGMEDFAWLAGDEFWPVGPDMVVSILEDKMPMDRAEPEIRYLSHFITFHIVQRLQLIYHRFMAAGWVDAAKAMKYDKIGVDPELAKSLCQRGAIWAERNELTRPMVPWFTECEASIETWQRPEGEA